MQHHKLRTARDRLEKVAREAFYGSPVFFPARAAYQLVFNRRKYDLRHKWRTFYAPFIRRGDLVFDVGAHVGGYSEVFSNLGATVVAVEPNPQCYRELDRLARMRNVYVEQCALGEVPGRAALRICEESTVCTLSETSYRHTKQHPVLHDAAWLGSIEVEIKTLDDLGSRHGIPSFVKIDAEGYDDRVLRGMSFLPAALSFEFLPGLPEVAGRCIDLLASHYEFNYMPESLQELVWGQWVGADECLNRIREGVVGTAEAYGDVLARRVE